MASGLLLERGMAGPLIVCLLALAADLVFLVSMVMLIVAAFQKRILLGFLVLFLPLAGTVYAVKHWSEVSTRYLLMIGSYTAMVVLIATSPELMTIVGRRLPGVTLLAHALGTPDAPVRSIPGGSRDPSAPPREARDLADTTTGSSASITRLLPVPVDPFAAQRAAVAKHAADLSAQYTELNKARAKLKKGSPQVAAFNAKAAKYQEGLRTLAAEQAQLNALDHPATLALAAPGTTDPKEAEANAALADTLKKCLADYRQTAAFPQIAATARGTLANATPDRLAAAIQAQGMAAHTEMDAAMERVRGIVNQTPPTVPRPPPDAESYHYGFHPGAITPDFAHADLFSTRELWKGDYVNMDTAPGIYYRSADCEFNPQTKFFYTNRDVPKKKLTDAEIAEVVRLYRAIAADQLVLAALPQRLHDAQGASADLLALNKQLAATR